MPNWDTSLVTDMNDGFGQGGGKFNGNIGSWDTSRVTNMRKLFYAGEFNQDIASWDTSQVTDMYAMFQYNERFNQAIGS